jgi:predicted transcriptional regulator
MRATSTLSITLPPEMLRRARTIAKRESRTMSELVREALRHYDRQTWWDEVNAYGRGRARSLGIGEEYVERIVQEARRGGKKKARNK